MAAFPVLGVRCLVHIIWPAVLASPRNEQQETPGNDGRGGSLWKVSLAKINHKDRNHTKLEASFLSKNPLKWLKVNSFAGSLQDTWRKRRPKGRELRVFSKQRDLLWSLAS